MGKKRRAWKITRGAKIITRARTGKKKRIWDQTTRERKPVTW